MTMLGQSAESDIVFDKTNQRVLSLDQLDGLSQPSVLSLAQDKLGYIWAATQSGLNRYDGVKFRQYFTDNEGLSGDAITSICDDVSRDWLWIGTKSGLSIYDYQHDTMVIVLKEQYPNIPSDNIIKVSCAVDGVYVATLQNGVYFIDAVTRNILINSDTTNARVYGQAVDSSGVYIATNSGIYYWTIKNNITVKLTNVKANSVLLDDDLLLFSQNDGHVYAYQINDSKLEPVWDLMISGTITHLVKNIIRAEERYILGSMMGVIFVSLDGVIIQRLKSSPLIPDTLSENNIESMLLDNANNLWLGTQISGLNYIKLGSTTLGHINRHTYPKSPLINDDMRSIVIDDRNNLWLGTSKGAFLYKDNEFSPLGKIYPALAKYDQLFISDVAVINNILWLLTLGDGIIAFDFDTKTVSLYLDSAPHSLFYNNIALYGDKIIVSSRGEGLLVYNEDIDDFHPFSFDAIDMIKDPFDLLVVGNELWFGTLGDGLYRYHNNVVERLTKDNGLSSNVIYMLASDNHGHVWVASSNGVTIIDNDFKVLQTFNKGDGLNSKAVWAIVNDNEGAMWLGTSAGLARIDIQTYEVTTFSLLDGVQSLEYNAGAAALSKTGRVFIGGINGFNQFMPNDVTDNQAPPMIMLTQVTVLGNTLDNNTVAVEHLKELKLSYQQDILSFNYTALNYSQYSIDFFYQIGGISSQWLKLNRGNNQINLMKIPPGQYQLSVYVQDDKKRRSVIHRLAISISPPWWWSNVSKLCYGLILLIFSVMFIKLKRRAYIHLETVVWQRTQQLSIKNDKLNNALTKLQQAQESLVESEKMASLGAVVAGVAHEINTPLGIVVTAVSYNRDELDKMQVQLEDKTLSLTKLTKSVAAQQQSYTLIWRNLTRAVDLITNFKKVAVDQSSEAARRINVKGNINDIINAIRSSHRHRDITVEVLGDDNVLTTTYPGPLYQIITNLVNNSLHHGFCHQTTGHINIEISQNNSHFTICYQDDGCGMTPEVLREIYEPFMTTKRNEGGSGLGMHIVYNLVTQVFKGEIKCRSTVDNGVTFMLILPFDSKLSV
ncbi:MAG: hypothetical protein HRU24_14175 [Gammaproteobacteria bacterium]|nr:hypothetical protein [Gammaproteobacteria bacterium]